MILIGEMCYVIFWDKMFLMVFFGRDIKFYVGI